MLRIPKKIDFILLLMHQTSIMLGNFNRLTHTQIPKKLANIWTTYDDDIIGDQSNTILTNHLTSLNLMTDTFSFQSPWTRWSRSKRSTAASKLTGNGSHIQQHSRIVYKQMSLWRQLLLEMFFFFQGRMTFNISLIWGDLRTERLMYLEQTKKSMHRMQLRLSLVI